MSHGSLRYSYATDPGRGLGRDLAERSIRPTARWGKGGRGFPLILVLSAARNLLELRT